MGKWSNEFFRYLIDKEWEKHVGPGGHYQWRMKDSPDDPRIRFTTDMALLHDAKYRAIGEEFASNMTALDEAFDSAWTALTTNGNVGQQRRNVILSPCSPATESKAC